MPHEDLSRSYHHVIFVYRHLPSTVWITISRTAMQAFNKRRDYICSQRANSPPKETLNSGSNTGLLFVTHKRTAVAITSYCKPQQYRGTVTISAVGNYTSDLLGINHT